MSGEGRLADRRLGLAPIDIWFSSWSSSTLEELKRFLTVDEIAWGKAFSCTADGARFAQARILRRRILARYVDAREGDLVFEQGEFGKPHLVGFDLEFNVSHCRQCVAIAVARAPGSKVGIDAVVIDDSFPLTEAIADAALTPRERAFLAAAGVEQRPLLFHRWWSRKEAYLKSVGLGLSRAPSDVCVAHPRDIWPSGRVDQTVVGEWNVMDLRAPRECVAAVAAQGEISVRYCSEDAP